MVFNADLKREVKNFAALTSFEIFECLTNPEDIEKILANSKNNKILPRKDVYSYHYLVPQSGQYVSFYSIDSLIKVSRKCYLYFNKGGKNTHMLSEKRLNALSLKLLNNSRIIYVSKNYFSLGIHF